MDLIQNLDNRRRLRVSQIVATIKKAFSQDYSIDREKLIIEICANYSTARRTSIEYLITALSQFNFHEEKIDDRIFIFEDKNLSSLPESTPEVSS